MKLVRIPDPFGLNLRESAGLPTTKVQLSERERATLRATAAIAEKLREYLEQDGEVDVDVALMGYTATELAEDGEVLL